MRASNRAFAVMILALAGALPAVADDGFAARAGDLSGPRWQARLAFDEGEVAGTRQWRKLSVMGDYYFGGASFAGFRATSGLIFGPRSALWAGRPTGADSRSLFSIDRQIFSQDTLPAGADTEAERGTLPYLGVGYTGLSARGAWSFSADLGVVALSPGQASRLGRVFGGTQNLDDLLRELRLAPVVQLGVSYSF